jgi:hypothetical protein
MIMIIDSIYRHENGTLHQLRFSFSFIILLTKHCFVQSGNIFGPTFRCRRRFRRCPFRSFSSYWRNFRSGFFMYATSSLYLHWTNKIISHWGGVGGWFWIEKIRNFFQDPEFIPSYRDPGPYPGFWSGMIELRLPGITITRNYDFKL